MAVTMPRQREFTVDDLEHFPDDGNRYEIIEGSLHVSAAPVLLHQRVTHQLAMALSRACPEDLEVLPGPGVLLGPATSLEPDICVVPIAIPGAKKVESPPELIVEVLSPSTRLYDLNLKRAAYRDGGVPAYWVVDPNEPSITEWRWDGDGESEQTVSGQAVFTSDVPLLFPFTVVPADLVLPGGRR